MVRSVSVDCGGLIWRCGLGFRVGGRGSGIQPVDCTHRFSVSKSLSKQRGGLFGNLKQSHAGPELFEEARHGVRFDWRVSKF